MNKVATIVVTFNRLILLKECIRSLRNQTYQNHTIIVINNGSTDDTEKWLNEQNDIITISQNNRGGAGGFFTGIKYACENGYDYSWVMDDDVEAYPDTLENLIKFADLTNGFICSRVLDINGDQCNVPRISKNILKRTGEWSWGQKLDKKLIGVDVTSFVSVLIPNKTVYDIGLPFKEYFIWGDDTEYTHRISSKYLSYMSIESIILHKRKLSSVLSIFTEDNQNRVKFYYYSYRNRIHNSSNIYKKIAFWGSGIFDSIRLAISGKWKKSKIVLKGCMAGMVFNPKIIFPKK